MKRVILAVLSLAAIAWATQAFWLQDHSLARYDPTRFVGIAIAVCIVVYAALSAARDAELTEREASSRPEGPKV